MAILKRTNKYQGLKDIDVLVEESGLSSQYFNIYDVPSNIPQGRSSFLLAGSPFLKNFVELKVEILDSAGQTVYTEPVSNYIEGNARRVSIEVYDDTAPGDAFLYIVGELRDNFRSVTGQQQQNLEVTDKFLDPEILNNLGGNDVPSDFQNIYNVRYVRPIFINTVIPNSEPIYFYQQPRVTVSEILKGYVVETSVSSSYEITGSVSVDPIPDLQPKDPEPDPIDGYSTGMNDGARDEIGNELEIFKNRRSSKIDPLRHSNYSSRGRVMRRGSPEIDRFTINVTSMETSPENTTNDTVTSAFTGGEITINNPIVDSELYPADEYTIPSQYKSSIKKVNNESTLVPLDDFYITKNDTGERIPVKIEDTANNVTMSVTPTPPQIISTTHYRSYADIIVGNLHTFSGDVYKAKIYARSKGTLADFEPVYDASIEAPQVLIDSYSETGFKNTGYFYTQSIVDNYWDVVNGTATQNNSKFIDGVLISGSNAGFTPEHSTVNTVEFNTSHSYDLQTGVPYTLEFNAYYYKEEKDLGQTFSAAPIKSAELEVFLSGSAMTGGSEEDHKLGKVVVNDNTTEGQVLGVHNTFTSAITGTPSTHLKFKATSGRWIIQDILLRPHSETNFNPSYFRTIVPMTHPLPKKPDQYDFLVEFYDLNNNIAETISVKENIDFVGAPQNIDGENNLLSGSLFVGNAQGSGFEMAGAASAYLRSLTYEGFDKTIASGSGGFMIWSGSVGGRLSSSEDYDGVGLEIVDAHGATDRYLKFRTNPSTFQVVTDEFFLGSTSQFVSGSDGNIEISSSNFHLQPDGDVIMAGTITATAGNIGDWTISGGDIIGSNITMDADGSRIYKTDENNELNGYYLDFTPGSNYYIRFGTNFAVSSSGTLIAEGAIIEGVLTSSEGLIAEWTIAPNTIHKLTDGTYTGLSSIGDTRFFSGASSLTATGSAPFNVKATGDITGSSVLFTGGKIANFTIDEHSLTTTGVEINDSTQTLFISSSAFKVKHDGEVSGSQVLFTGGKIGGWTLASSTLTGGNTTLNSDGVITLGSTPNTSVDGVNQGIYMDGTGDFLIYGSSTNYFKMDGTSLDIKVSTFDLDATSLIMDSAGDSGNGVIRLGASGGPSSPTANTTGIYMDGGGALNIYGNATNYFRIDGGSFSIKSDTFDLDATTIIMDSGTNEGKIALGGTPPTAYNSGNGFYVDGTGKFLVGSGSGDHLQFDGTNFDVQVGSLELDATNIEISSTNASMSLGEGKILLDGSNDLIRVGSNASNNVKVVGTATQGYIHTGKTSATSTTAGFWLANNDGDPEFHVGNSSDFLKFDGGSLDIQSQKLEISSSTLQMSTTQASMSLGHTVANPYGKIIVEGNGTPTFRVGPDAHFISMTTGSGIYMDGDGAFKFGDADGNVSFDGTSFAITGSDVDINVTDLNITATGFKLSSTQASMSLGTNEQWFVEANGTSPYMSLGQSTKAYGNAGVFIGYVNSVSRPKVSFVGSTGHFKIDQDVDIKTETFELDANSGDLQISSAHKSMSLNDGTIILDGPNKKITVGTSNAVTIQGGGNGGVDNYIVMGTKADFSHYDKSTEGIIMGMDTSVPKFEMAKSSTNYLRWDTTSGLDLATEAMEVSASNIQISSAQASMSIGPSQTNPIVLQSLGTDRYLKFGSKTDFDQSSTAGFIMGIDNGTPKFDFTISATNYLRVDGSNVDIKTPNFKLDTATLDIDSTTRRIQVFDTGSGERVRIGEISDSASDLYGFKIYDGSGTGDSNTLVKLGQEGNRIAGWTINQTSLFSNNIFIHSEGSIETADFVSNEKGWRISADGNGTAEFENVRIRGTLSTAVFEKESVNAVGGQLYIANSTAITGSFVSASHATMSVVNSTGFTGSYSNDFGEILTAKKVDSTGFQTEYMLVRSASRDFPDSEDNFAGQIYVERAWGSGSSGEFVGDLASTSQSYEPGQVIVSTGLSGSGYIRLNANPNDTSTPYMDIVERTGSGIYDVEHKVRVGDLSGLSAGKLYGETNPGFGLYGENVFLSGSITATSGSIKGRMHITTSPSEEILLGTNINGSNDGIYINNNNYWYTTAAFKVGSANYYLSNDASGNIVIKPQTFELDADTGELQISSTEHSMSFNDDDILIHAKDSGGSHIRVGRNVDRAIVISGSQAHGAIYSGKTNVGSTTAGFWLANNNTDPEFHLGDSINSIKYDGGSLSMTTQTFELNAGTGELQISSAETSMSLGDRSVILAKSGSGGGYAQFGQDITKAIQISGSSTQGTIRSVKDSLTDDTAGFWLSNHNGTQEFFVGTATEHIKFDGSNMSLAGDNLSLTAATVDVTTGTIKVDADDFQINSTVPSMSLGYDTNVSAGMTIVGGSPSRIGFGPKSSYNMELASTTTDDYLTVGGKTWGGTDDGIIIGSDGGVYKLEMYADADNYFTYASTGVVDIRTDTFDLQGTNMALNNTRMYLGEIQSDSDTSGAGVYMDNGGAFRVQGNTTNYIRVDGGSMALATDDFSLDTAKGDIIFNSLVQRISMGASPPTTFTANGIILSGSGYFNLQKDQYNYIRHDASGLGLASQELNVSGSTTFRLHGNSTGSKIRLGASADSITETANTGIYMDSAGKFRVGTATSGTSYIHFGTTLDIKTPSFKLDTANLDIDSAAGGSGSIALGVTPPTSYDSGNGFFVDGSGKLLLGDTTGNHLSWDGSNVTLVGTIRQTTGGATITDYVDRGTWAVATAYAVNDLVQYASGGNTSTYKCLVAHTSADPAGSHATTGTPNVATTGWGVYVAGSTGAAGSDGDDGAAGANAKTTVVNSDSLVFVKAQDGTYTPTGSTMRANNQNTTGDGAWSTSAGTLTSTVNTHTAASTHVTSGNFADGMIVTYTLAGGDGSVTDSVTLKELDEGSGTVQAILSNAAHVLPASSAGAVSSYVGSGTTIRVYEGATELTFVTGTPAAGQWAVSVGDTANITEGGVTDSGTYCTIGVHSGAANGTDEYVITYTISGKTANGTSFTTFTQDQSLSKSKSGADGADGAGGSDSKTVSLTSANYVIVYNAAGSSPSPSGTLTLTATSQNFTNGWFKFTGDGITDETTFTDGSGANADTFSFSVPASHFATPKALRVGASEGDQSEVAFDTITISAVQPGSDGSDGDDGDDGSDGAAGADAYTIVLTNEAHALPTTSGGTVTYTGSGTTIIVYKGATQQTGITSGTPGSGQFAVTPSATNITAGAESVNSGDSKSIDFAVASSATAATSNIEFSINLENAVTVTKTQTFNKTTDGDDGAAGVAGLNGATVSLYNKNTSNSSAPTAFTGTITYTFSTGGVSTDGALNSWTTAVPSLVAGEYAWVRQSAASANTSTDTIGILEWSTAVMHSGIGSDGASITGAAGNSNALVSLFRVSTDGSSAPTAFTGTITYTFATGGVATDGNLQSWTTTVPTIPQGSFLWTRQAVASANTSTDTIAIGEWSTAVVTAASGDDGDTGPAGAGTVFRGDWDASKTYTNTSIRRDIVDHSAANASNPYWICLHDGATGLGEIPPLSGASSNTYWETFGATFSSVATDILLAQNATITHGLVIGQDGSDEGFIRSTNASSTTAGTGFYFHEDGTSWMGNRTGGNYLGISSAGVVTAAGFTITSTYLTSDTNKSSYSDTSAGVYLGTDGIGLGTGQFKVSAAGAITATSGNIAGWTIDDSGILYGTGLSTGASDSGLSIQFHPGSSVVGSQFYSWGNSTGDPNAYLAGLSLTWHAASNAGHIVMGQVASNVTTLKTGFYGIQMMNHLNKEYFCLSADASTGASSTVYNRIAGWAFDDTTLSSNNVEINSAGKIRMGSSLPASALSGTGFYADQNSFLVGDASGNRIQFTGTSIVLQSNTFALNTDTIVIDSGVNSGKISLGASGGPTSVDPNTTARGIYMDGTGDVLIKASSSANTGYVKFTSAGLELKTAALTFETDGTITSQNYLVERSRIFGTGDDGDLTISSGTTTMSSDKYYADLTIDSGATLDTNGYRLFVKGTLTNNGTISNNGSPGTNGTTRTNPGSGGAGGTGNTLSSGTNGVVGGLGGLGDDQSGSAGGGSGGSGGIIFISARIIVNNGTIESLGGNGGNGGNGSSAIP